ncbi:MAG: maleylpyruvate isomerase family mycothiol-dependent enzyme [Chloroflexi bacterium]|nr:maleylpyruvate isomerase family mycothiol-dependent enzyme [Chloroflexota bacterium]
MNAALSSSLAASAERIPYVTADEAFTLMQTAFDRFMRLIESLEPEDWNQPTACTEWNVHDMVAHQAGGYASGAGYREFIRQVINSIPKPGALIEDSINALQLRERADKSPSELIAELHQVGPIAIQKWAYQFRLIRYMPFPHPIGGVRPLRHMLWVIHSRDTWMHRLDICRATGRPFEQTREHDGRINELVVMETAQKLKGKLGTRAITLVLTGVAGGTWKVGKGNPEAEIEMDALDFNIFVSGRFSYEEAMKRASISGDKALVELAFKNFIVLY